MGQQVIYAHALGGKIAIVCGQALMSMCALVMATMFLFRLFRIIHPGSEVG